MAKKILYIAPSLPILTCTFIYREIFDLRNLGFTVDSVSMNTPPQNSVSDEARGLLKTTLYLDKIRELTKFYSFVRMVFTNPMATFRCLRLFFAATPMRSPRDYLRLGYHLIEACYLASELRKNKPDHIHSHFVTSATSIAMFLSVLLNVPFSFTMHASAIWIDPIALKTKLSTCRFCVSISEYNMNYVLSTYGEEWGPKFNIVHCGIPFHEMPDIQPRSAESRKELEVLAVGQLMVRKGYHVLIEAARILRDRRVAVNWTIVGEGEERPRLERMISEYGLEKQITLVGAKLHEEIPEFLAKSDVFTLPCVIGDDNTRDGIPVALMEAMAWRLPVVSTNILGLPELIETGKDGILVDSGSSSALADAIQELAASETLRRQIGEAGALKVQREFNSMLSAKQLGDLFDASI